uniref:Ribonuclease H n=1 Tax=Tanacetum cinerariifolium TaxID=118510 RepID=A0A699HXU0_TANCI|nr:ribonuclease H [Tanacetum cinerariifolium]
MSSAEAEYVALSVSCAQVMWMRTQLKNYGFNYNKIPLYYDSQSTIAISCNPVQHSRTKHINVRYHFIKEQVERGIIELYFVRTEYQLANMFTKSLPEERFQYLIRRTVMMEILPKPTSNKLCGRYKRRCCCLIPAESDSLPHAYAQATKTYNKHQESRIKKAIFMQRQRLPGSKVTAKQNKVISPTATMSCNSTEVTGLGINSIAGVILHTACTTRVILLRLPVLRVILLLGNSTYVSQPQPRFKEPQPQPTKDNRKGKRVTKRATVDLVDENEEEEEPIRHGGSASGSLSDYVSEDLRHKLQAGTSTYEAKKAKEMAMIEFKEMEFLTIDAYSLLKPKASIIQNRQEKIVAKYTQQ